MSVLYRQASKQRYRITLELETQGDFDPYQIHWEDLFETEGNEHCEAYVEDLSTPTPGELVSVGSPVKCLSSVHRFQT